MSEMFTPSGVVSEPEELGFVLRRSTQRTHLLKSRSTTGGDAEEASNPDAAGVIYTTREDMPSLEDLLRQNDIAMAVLEKPMPITSESFSATGNASHLPIGLIAASGIAASVSVVGWVLFVASVRADGIHANPYTALSLALGGIVLLATLIVGLKAPKN